MTAVRRLLVAACASLGSVLAASVRLSPQIISIRGHAQHLYLYGSPKGQPNVHSR